MAEKGRRNRIPSLVGEEHPLSKITAEVARKIRDEPGTGKSIAAKYGVSPSLVRGIKWGTHWKHA
jgi:hypothetical protein